MWDCYAAHYYYYSSRSNALVLRYTTNPLGGGGLHVVAGAGQPRERKFPRPFSHLSCWLAYNSCSRSHGLWELQGILVIFPPTDVASA